MTYCRLSSDMRRGKLENTGDGPLACGRPAFDVAFADTDDGGGQDPLDGFTDEEEAAGRSDPLNAGDTPFTRRLRLYMRTIESALDYCY